MHALTHNLANVAPYKLNVNMLNEPELGSEL